jgi:hypothetical protein
VFEYKNKDWLYQKYITERFSSRGVAKLCNTNQATILKWLRVFNIPRRPQGNWRAERHYNWKGGRTYGGGGYIYVYQRGHPSASKDEYVYEHRLVMEEMLGRYLRPGETVHHKNGIKNDNRPENLALFESGGKHSAFHFGVPKITLTSV